MFSFWNFTNCWCCCCYCVEAAMAAIAFLLFFPIFFSIHLSHNIDEWRILSISQFNHPQFLLGPFPSTTHTHTHTLCEQKKTKMKKKIELLAWCWKKIAAAASRLMLHINIDFLPIMFRRPKRSTFSHSLTHICMGEKKKLYKNNRHGVNWKQTTGAHQMQAYQRWWQNWKKWMRKEWSIIWFGLWCRCHCRRRRTSHQKAPI